MSSIFKQKIYQDFFQELPHSIDLLKPWINKDLIQIGKEFIQETEQLSDVAQRAVQEQISPILGLEVAVKTVNSLKKSSRILCMHHLGVECMAEQVQIIHFFKLNEFINHKQEEKFDVIPILACTSIPLQSYSYPRGFMTARRLENGQHLRLPLFPSSMQNTMVHYAPKITLENTLAIQKQWKKDFFTKLEWEVINEVVNSIVMDQTCLDLPKLSSQFMYINNRLFKHIYPDHQNLDLVYLDLEDIAVNLIAWDLSQENSILSQIFFDPNCRNSVFKKLVNERGCFSQNAIDGKNLDRCANDGSIFFWASDENGRRLPLALRQDPLRLVYKDISIPFEPESLIAALKNGQIIPTLFSSFISLHLQHKILCYGGLYMAEYIPKMLNSVISTLQEFNPEHAPNFPKFTAFATGAFTVQSQVNTQLFPAGSIEIIGAGGLKERLINEISQLKFSDVLPLALKEWSLYFTKQEIQTIEWLRNLEYASTKWNGIIL